MIGYGVVGTEAEILPRFFRHFNFLDPSLEVNKANFADKFKREFSAALETWNLFGKVNMVRLKDDTWFIGMAFDLHPRLEILEDIIDSEIRTKICGELEKMGLSNPKLYVSGMDFSISTH